MTREQIKQQLIEALCLEGSEIQSLTIDKAFDLVADEAIRNLIEKLRK